MARPVRLPPGSGSLQEPLGRLRGEADEAAHGVQFLGVGNAGPLVHEEFLELQSYRASSTWEALVDEPGLRAFALEGDIFPDVEPPTVEIEVAHRLHQWVEQEGPLLA